MDYDKTISQIESDEGIKLFPYRCTEGYLTIGVGRNLETNGISRDEAKALLLNDLERVEEALNKQKLLQSEENSARKAVLINMAFQLGVTGLLKFKNTIACYRYREYEDAAKEMLDSKWAEQTPNRARRLVEQMRTGEWQ